MRDAKELSRTLSEFIDLGLNCLSCLGTCDLVQIYGAFVCQMMKNIPSFNSLGALLLAPGTHEHTIIISSRKTLAPIVSMQGSSCPACFLFKM